MKFWKKSIIITILIIVSWTSWFFWNKNEQAKIEAENKAKLAYTVKLWNIKTEVKVTSTAKLANEQNLSFWQEWKITKVYVKVWDEVKAWAVLAELSMDDYKNAVQTAQLELENARLGLTKLLNNDTSLREAQLNSQINESKSTYDVEVDQEKVLREQLNTILKQKKDQLEQLVRDYKTSAKNLEIAKSWLDVTSKIETEQTQNTITARNQTIDTIVSSLNTTLWDVETIVESVDRIYWVSTQFKDDNNSYENYLWVKNVSTKYETESYVLKWYDLINKYRDEFKKINSEMTDSEIYTLIQNYYKDTAILVTLCDKALDSIDQSVESIWSLTSTMISNFKTIVTWSRVSALSLRSQLETFSTSINSLLSSSWQTDKLQLSIEQKNLDYEKQQNLLQKQSEDILSLAKDIENLEKDNENQLNRKKAQISSLLEKIDVLQKELKDLQDWPDEYDIKQQENLIWQAKLRLERTIDQKDNYQIIAEFNWRIRTIDIVEWEQYKLDDRKYIVVENPNLIELELQVSQIDIVKIKENDPVVVTFDAYPNQPIVAKVNSRNVNPEPNQRGGVYYKATILIEKQELEILAWMSALVTVTTNKADNVLLIPSLALIQEWTKKYVYLKDWEEYKIHEIKTWIVNNFQAEVTEWLKEWDVIKSSVLDDKALKEMWIDEWGWSIFWN